MSDLSRETSALLDHGRDGESLDPASKARLKRALLAQVAGVSVMATTSTASAWSTLSVATATKVLGVVAIAATVTGGAMMIAAPQRSVHPRGAAPSAAQVASASPSPVPPRERLPRVEPVAEPEPAKAAASPLTPPAPKSAPLGSSPATTRFTSSLEAEAAMLGQADDALKAGTPARALRILDDLAAQYPESSLAPERAAERVFALCMAERVTEAHAAMTDFDALGQTGPLADRVHASCANRPGPAR